MQAPGIGGAVYLSSSGGAGTFSTGTGGSAVITTTGGIQAGTSGCSAIIDNTVYGTVTLPDSQYGKTLTVSENANLTIPNGATLRGSITVNDGGTLTVNSGSTVTNSGTITNNGTLTGDGTIHNTDSGKVTGDTGNVKVTYPSTVEVSSSTSGTAVPGQEVTFTATVTGNGGTPHRQRAIQERTQNLGEPQSLDGDGKATYATSDLVVGEHTITVEYIPASDAAYTGSSSTLEFTVVGDVENRYTYSPPTKMEYETGDTLNLSGLEITVHYVGSTYTQNIAWGEGSGITSDPENGTELSTSQHNGQTITITYEGKTATTNALTVNKADQTDFGFTDGTSKTVTYSPDGTFALSTTGGSGSGDVTYAVNEGGEDVIRIDGTTAAILKAGEATITATKAADGDYNKATATLTVTVEKATPTVTPPQAVENLTFTGEAQALITAGTTTGGTLVYSLEQNGEYTETIPTGTDAKAYTVWYKVNGDENYNNTTAQSVSVSIGKAAATVTKAPEAVTGLTYTGNPQDLVTAGEAEGGTMQYSTEENGTYSTDIPTGTNAGDYTVWYKVVGDENHSDTQPVKIEVTIAGVSITDDNVTLSTTEFTYNGQEQKPTVTVILDDKNLVVDTDYEVSYNPTEVKDAGTYTVTVTGKGSYEGTVQKTFTIQKADPVIGNVTYGGGVLYESTALNSITLNRSNTTVPGTLKLDAGQTLRADVSSYKWTFTPDDTTNYKTVTGTVQLTVQADALTGLSVQTNPDKTEYVYGDFFDKTGLVLEATYESGNKKEISADEITVETTGPLTCDMTAVTVSYQGMECQVPVTVNKATYSGQTTVTGTIWANTASEVQLPQPPDGATFGNPV